MEVGLSSGDFVLDGDPAPSPIGGVHSPQFSVHVYCGQTAEWIKMPLGTKVGLGPSDIVLHEEPAPPPKKRHSLQFSAHVYCDQTAVCIRIPLGTEVGLSHGRPSQLLLSSCFYSEPQCSHCKRCTSYSNSVRLSVCLSVCPSHTGIVSKRRQVARCSLHCWIAKCV